MAPAAAPSISQPTTRITVTSMCPPMLPAITACRAAYPAGSGAGSACVAGGAVGGGSAGGSMDGQSTHSTVSGSTPPSSSLSSLGVRQGCQRRMGGLGRQTPTHRGGCCPSSLIAARACAASPINRGALATAPAVSSVDRLGRQQQPLKLERALERCAAALQERARGGRAALATQQVVQANLGAALRRAWAGSERQAFATMSTWRCWAGRRLVPPGSGRGNTRTRVRCMPHLPRTP